MGALFTTWLNETHPWNFKVELLEIQQLHLEYPENKQSNKVQEFPLGELHLRTQFVFNTILLQMDLELWSDSGSVLNRR